MPSITAQQTKLDLELEDFIYQIENRVYKKQEKMYYPRFTKAIIHHFLIHEKTLSSRNKIRMHTSKDDYLINSLSFVSAKESSQTYGAILPECLTSPAMKESKAYKTYLGYATGAVPPKIARKFKKTSPSKKDSDLVQTKSKRKEKVDVARGKGIKLLSEVALTEEAQMKKVTKKSLGDFHKTYPSGSGTVVEKPPRVDKITPTATSEGTGDKPGVLDVTENESTESKSESWGNDEDKNNNDNDSKNEGNDDENKSDDDKTPSDSEKALDFEQDSNRSESYSKSNQQEFEEEFKDDDDDDDNSEGDKDRGMDDMTKQFSDDVQDKKADETKVPDTSISHSSNLASKFLNFLDIHPNDGETVSMLDVHVHHEVPRIHTSTLLTVPVLVIPEASHVCTAIPQSSQTFTSLILQTTPTPPPIVKTTNIPSLILDFTSVFQFNDRFIALEQDVAELKKDPLHTQVTALVDDHLDTRMGATREEFINFLLASLTDRITEQEPKFEAGDTDTPQGDEGNLGNDDVEPRKESASRCDWFTKHSQPQETTNPEWNKDKTPQKGPTQNWLTTLAASTSTDKSVLKGTISNYAELEYDFEECYKALSEKLYWENPKGVDYPFDISKALPLITRGNLQSVLVEFFINNDLKYLQGGILTMTYTTSNTKTKAAQYDLPGIEDMVPNIWSPVKVAYDKYSYLEEIVVRRADNVLYRFKEGDFPRLQINDIKDMLLLVVQNRLINISGDDVADFVIALRMFTRSLVIQKRVKDNQLGVKSYQKQINVTKPDTTRPDLKKRHPYTPYKDPQGFIYVED
uniref:Uncharacterized protein n=1 Tax=Tanacetum cinerariifolium TaxID=118510 RepID=A0A699HNY4_TANCI|nr:hypothetical protein [Tanacetum cinerariifolium]